MELETREITDSGKFPYIFWIMLIFVILFFTTVFCFLFQELYDIYWVFLFYIPAVIGVIFLILWLLHSKLRFTDDTRIQISNNGINVIVPTMQPFQISWSDITSIKMRVYGYPGVWDTVGEVVGVATAVAGYHSYGGRSPTRYLRFHFVPKDLDKPLRKLQIRLFHDEKVKEVLQLIVEYGRKLNIYLNIHEGTEKFYNIVKF